MDRSIRKSISVNELNFIFMENSLKEDKRSRLIPELFENPQSENFYLLKENIRTAIELKDRIGSVVDDQNCISAIENAFVIKDDLVIPHELRKVLFSNVKIAFFVGAGVSKLLNIPLWAELSDKAITYLRDNNYINHTESVKLKNEKYTAKQIMSIFDQVVRDKDKIREFYEEHLKGKENKKGNPYALFYEIEKILAKPIIKIQTNIDIEWEKILKDKSKKQKLEQTPEGKPTYSKPFYVRTQYKDFTNKQGIEADILYQIHGSLNDLESAILTTSQYVKSYREDSGLKGFLENVFQEYCVLFIGSGIQEFEILEHCLKDSPFQHYALVPTRIGDENLFRIRKTYFEEIRIKPIPYYLDFQWHDRLLLLLQSWVDQILSDKPKKFYDDIKLIDEVL